MKVLLIEDDNDVAAFVERGLREAGCSVTQTDSPKQGMVEAMGNGFDVIILDRMLPDMDGIDALRLMRGSKITTPVLMLTARGGLEDRVEGLEAGADDYLVKPFAFSELLARLNALHRRPPVVNQAQELTLGPLVLNRTSRTVRRANKQLDLSPLEFRLLEFMMQHESEVVTRTMLLEKVWGYSFDPKTSLVQTHMSRLRAKVDKPFDTDLFTTIRGAGYVIATPE